MTLPHVAGQPAGQPPIHAAATPIGGRQAGSCESGRDGMSPPRGAASTTRKPLPPALPPMAPSPELVASLVADTNLPIEVVRRWLEGGSVQPVVRDSLREALWAPLRNLPKQRRAESFGAARTTLRTTLGDASTNVSAREQTGFASNANGHESRPRGVR